MMCKNHPERESSRTCDECGSVFCDNYLIEVRGKNYCQSCAQKILDSYKNEKQKQEQIKKERIEAERAAAVKQTTQSKSGCLFCAINIFIIIISISVIITLIIILTL